MGMLADMKMYGRFAWGLRGFLKHTLTLEEAKAIIKKRMEEREINFLRLVRKGIFGYPKSPYLPLLKLAHCEMGDIENMARDKGLEGTLHSLREAGVYITFEEFKGRAPIVRNGKELSKKNTSFDNPYLSHYYHGKTGGSTGAGTRVALDLSHLAGQAPFLMVGENAHGLWGLPTVIWRGVLPDESGISAILMRHRNGNLPRYWFVPITKKEYHPSFKNRIATRYVILIGRLFGTPVPWPEFVPFDRADRIVRCIDRILQSQAGCLISTHVSMALRLSLTAHKEGISLTGTTFIGAGEPPTDTKVSKITRTGARYVPNYFFAETGVVGIGCAHPSELNDLHLFKDGLALIQHPRQLPEFGIQVEAFYFTALLPTAPKLMLNVESDDYGVVETRSCGCPMERLGYTEHIRQIRSFRKLTGEGVTLVGSEMVRILEEVLPKRFGGTPLDYQLMEEEDEEGFTRLNLLIHPRLWIQSESDVIETVIQSLSQSSVAADLARAMWMQAKTLQIKRKEPFTTAHGKMMPIHMAKKTGKD